MSSATPHATPMPTRAAGPIHSFSNAYLRKNATPIKRAAMPTRLSQCAPMMLSTLARGGWRVAGATAGGCGSETTTGVGRTLIPRRCSMSARRCSIDVSRSSSATPIRYHSLRGRLEIDSELVLRGRAGLKLKLLQRLKRRIGKCRRCSRGNEARTLRRAVVLDHRPDDDGLIVATLDRAQWTFRLILLNRYGRRQLDRRLIFLRPTPLAGLAV